VNYVDISELGLIFLNLARQTSSMINDQKDYLCLLFGFGETNE